MNVRDLTAEEIEEVTESQAAGLVLSEPDDTGSRDMTHAELAMLQAEGFDVEQGEQFLVADSNDGVVPSLSSAEKNPDIDVEHGQRVYLVGRNNGNHFKAKMLDESASTDMVYVYDVRGQPFAVFRSMLALYLNKTGPDGVRIFTPRPRMRVVKPYPCDAPVCHADGRRKMLQTELMRDRHIRNRHPDIWRDREEARQRSNDNVNMQTNQALVQILTKLVNQGQVQIDADDAAVLNAAAGNVPIEAVPDETWSKRKIVDWMLKHGHEYTALRARMGIKRLLIDLGLVDDAEMPAEAI
jgi:hypothetical protein